MALKPCEECGAQVSNDAKSCPHCGKKTKSGIGISGLIVIFLVLGALAPKLANLGTNEPTPEPSAPSAIDLKRTALSQVTLNYRWGIDDGAFMKADFTVVNKSNFNIKDFEITCKHFAKSGTEIDSNTRTIYDIVRAHSTKKFPNFDMGFIHSQAARSGCSIVDLSIAQ